MESLEKLLAHQPLTFQEARQLLRQIQEDLFSDDQLRALLIAFREKGETADEIAGFASVMRETGVSLTPQAPVVVDTAGTGGDGLNTFNISTAAAFVIAGAGVPVAKHGNRGASSQNGSADVMRSLGIEVDLEPRQVEHCLNDVGMAFCFAPKFHQATSRVAKIRRELGVRTIFNLLGPLTNPAKVKHQVIGVCGRDLAQRMAAVCQRLGSEHVWVVSSEDGADELLASSLSYVCELREGKLSEFEIIPEEYGFSRGEIEELAGGDARENAEIVEQILLGEDQSARRDTVLLNAAAGIYVGGEETFDGALRRSQDSLDEGRAYEKLQQLITTTRQLKTSSEQ